MQEQFGDVASAKNLVNGCKSGRTLVGAEVGGEYAVSGTLSSEELACPAG